MSNKFLCTVLLITYNCKDTFERAIESILEQESKYPYKIHVFDDGSTDGTKDLILKYAEQYKDIVFPFIAPENQGPQANYWGAFTSADTKYCVLLEGDDFYCHPKKIELQIDALERHPECSFCGHDTLLYSEGEAFREYEEGSKAMTAGLLKTKTIFTYEDFVPVTTGGYIAYGSARMIRTEALHLDEIRYKEAVLFDFSQFYYLLLQGNYYYIDLPMSVYVRNGTGICSGKSPVVFLNDFLQGAIDFNKETNNVIADKIYSDCMLQISFRLMLYSNSVHPLLDSAERKLGAKSSWKKLKVDYDDEDLFLLQHSFSDQYYYYLCNGGLGHTMVICAYKNAIEERLNGKCVLLVRSDHAFIPEMYGIKDYLCVNFDNMNLVNHVNLYPNPEKGKVYVTHPFTHPEQANYIRPVHGLYSTVPYLPWLLQFMDLPTELECALPEKPRNSEQIAKKAASGFGDIDKIVLFFPEARTLQCISDRVWKKKAEELQEEGLVVLSCTKDQNRAIAGTRYVDLTAEEAVCLGCHCHSVYTMRNGIADLLAFRGRDLHVFYPTHATFFIYSLNTMFRRTDIQEEIVLEHAPAVAYAPAVAEASTPVQSGEGTGLPRRPYLFGRIPAPLWVYQFYLKHKKYLEPFKKIAQWR